MITNRLTKGYDLTHEELDENFRTFDSKQITLSGIGEVCPIGDKWVFSTIPTTSLEYAIIGTSSFTQGIMTETPITTEVKAFVAKNKNINHTATLNPKPIEEFYVFEEIEVEYNPNIDNTVNVIFSDYVDLIEISTNIAESPAESTDLHFINGEATSMLGEGIVNGLYTSVGGNGDLPKIYFRVLDTILPPSLGSEIDPLGDGSQIHYFKLDGDGLDVCGNGVITGNDSYNSSVHLWGTHCLEVVNNAELYIDLHESAYNTGVLSVLYAGRRKDGDGLADLQMADNTYRSKSIVGLRNSTNELLHTMGSLLGQHTVFSADLDYITNSFFIGDEISSGTTEDGSGIAIDPYAWAVTNNTFFTRDNTTTDYSVGFAAYHGENPPIWDYLRNEDQTDTQFSIDSIRKLVISDPDPDTDWDVGNAYMDGIRVFNRHLKPSETMALNSTGLGEILPTLYTTDITDVGSYQSVYHVVESGSGVGINLSVDSNLVSFGIGTVDYINVLITYEYRVAMLANEFSIKIDKVNANFAGNKITVKGYKQL